MTKIDFNMHNYGHRLMLALAVRDYTNTPGQSLSGRHEADPRAQGKRVSGKSRAGTKTRAERRTIDARHEAGAATPGETPSVSTAFRLKSLLEELREWGFATSKSQLDRIVQAPHPDNRGASYPHEARQVVNFLRTRGYFPPGQDIDKTLKILPLFFDGFASGAPGLMEDVEGEYHTYHYSSSNPDIIVVGHLKIDALTEWNFARVEHTIKATYRKHNTLIYEGIAFSDEERNLYILMREHTHRYPRFFVFDDCDRPNGKFVEAIYGSLLGAARLRKRHLSPIVLHRAHHPRPPHEITVEQASQLPAPIRRYLIPGA